MDKRPRYRRSCGNITRTLETGKSYFEIAKLQVAIDWRGLSAIPVAICNLYSITRSQDAMRRLFAIRRDLAGNLPLLPAVFPDTLVPVIRLSRAGERELEMMRWGFPPPPNLGKAPVTNVRNTASPFWRGWLKAEWRGLVPATSFFEWTDSRPKVTHWFAVDASRPLFAFAGIGRLWTGERKGETGEHRLFSFLTTEANDVVRPIHAKAMPVLLTTPNEGDIWLSGPLDEALKLQRPLPAHELQIVANGGKGGCRACQRLKHRVGR
jgi:putative SOS response-associated peptidase YedK